MGVRGITDYCKKVYSLSGTTTIGHLRRLLLDLRANLTDNCRVETVMNLIYSPSDMPQGLGRGFAFRSKISPLRCAPVEMTTRAANVMKRALPYEAVDRSGRAV